MMRPHAQCIKEKVGLKKLTCIIMSSEVEMNLIEYPSYAYVQT